MGGGLHENLHLFTLQLQQFTGPFFFSRRRKRQSATGQDGHLLSVADDSLPCTDRPPVPPQLVLPPEGTSTLAEERRHQGNGDLRIPKSVSGHSLNGGDQRSMTFLPDQLSSTFLAPLGRAQQWYNLVRSRSEDAEENWPIIQPESIDKSVGGGGGSLSFLPIPLFTDCPLLCSHWPSLCST